jgi:ribosomal protein S18 acetylase RimI-like enzyme
VEPSAGPLVELRVLSGTPAERAGVRHILQCVPDYTQAVHGGPFPPEEADAVFDDLPPGGTRETKLVCGLFSDDAMVGISDLARDYPNRGTAMIGLLAIDEAYRRKGLGLAATRHIEDLVRDRGCTVLRIGVVASNGPAFPFWRSAGFMATGESRLWVDGTVRSEVIVMEKAL